MTADSRAGLGRSVKGAGLRLFMNAISPSLLPVQDFNADDEFPTSLLVSLFGEQENWTVRGEEVGGALLRELRLSASMNTERALRETVRWLKAHHPGDPEVRVENADYRGAEIVIRLDYPPAFLQGIFQRICWGTRGKSVIPSKDDPYRLAVRY